MACDSLAKNPEFGLRRNLSGWRKNGRSFKKKVGVLPFTPAEMCKERLEYTTIGGPYLFHPDVVVYGNSIRNTADSLNRIDAARENEDTLLKNNLSLAPGLNRGLSRYLDSYYRKVRGQLQPELFRLGSELEEQISSATDVTHAKYELRLRSIIKLLEREDMMSSLFMKHISHKVKVPECAKSGKGSRGIGDYSCPGSLLCPFLVKPLKHAFSTRVEHDGCVIRFVESTECVEIDDILTEMYNSQVNYFIYFSDDMCCKIFHRGVPRYFNLDISSCDKSNGVGVFERLRWFYASTIWGNLIDKAILQCKQNLYIKNPSNPNEYITAKVNTPTEFSGTLLTTLLNNIAASSICLSIHYHLKKTDDLTVDQLITKAAFAVGYKVTGEECHSPEDIQFLKMSFWQDDGGNLHSFLNLGAVVRAFGTCWMDYPYNSKKGEKLIDAVRFRNWSVLQGYKHCGDNILMQALSASPGTQRPNCLTEKTMGLISKQTTSDLLHKSWTSSTVRLAVPIDSLLKRYRMTREELVELCGFYQSSDVGSVIHCDAGYKLLARDYSYSERKKN